MKTIILHNSQNKHQLNSAKTTAEYRFNSEKGMYLPDNTIYTGHNTPVSLDKLTKVTKIH